MAGYLAQLNMGFLAIALFCLILSSQAEAADLAHSKYVKQYRSGLDQASDIAISEDGRLYILDGSHHRVVVLDPDGQRLFIFGKEGKGAGQLNLPMAITIKGDKVYIADTGNHRIAIFELRGWFVQNISLTTVKEESELPEPVGLVVQDDVITWSDRRNHRVCRSDLITRQPARCWGNRGEIKSEFQFPFHIATDRDGYLHVIDVLNGRVQVFNRKGKYFTQISRFGLASGELYRPNGIAFADDGRMFVSDSYRGTVSIFVNGRFSGLLSVDGKTARNFKAPVGLAWNKDRLYVVDAISNGVEVFKSTANDMGIMPTENLKLEKNRISRKNCDICHFSWAESYHSEQKEQDGVLPVASQDMCYSCHHGAVIDSRKAIGRGKQHPDIHHKRKKIEGDTAKRKDEIPEDFPLLADKQLSCGSCHTPHTSGVDEAETLYESHANPWLRVLNEEGDLCQKCHESKLDSSLDKKHPVSGINHPVGTFLKAPQEEDSEGYAKSEKLQNGLPGKLKKAGGSLGSEQQMLCQSCHQIHGANSQQLLLSGIGENELCASCHENMHSKDAKEARQKGVHPVNIEMDEAVELGGEQVKKVTCQVCHSVHEGREDSKLLTRNTEDIEQLCASCHQRHHAKDEKDAIEKGVHVVNVELEEPVKMGKEDVTKVTCLSCHSIHAGKPDTAALRFEHKNGELCAYCHEGNEEVVNTDHDLRITADKSINKFEQSPEQAGACGSCHSMHRAEGKAPFLYSGKFTDYEGKQKIFQRDQICLDCHREKGVAEKAVVKYFSHPYEDLVLRSDPKIMPLLDDEEKVSEFGAIACITCHEPHHWELQGDESKKNLSNEKADNKNGNVLNSFLRLKSVKNTFCVDCHGIETRLKYKYYHDKLSRDVGLDYIR